MGKHAEKIKCRLKHVRNEMIERLNKAARAAEEIVEEGTAVTHHDVPASSKMLPFPITHCPLSSQPLYTPPSIEQPDSKFLKEMGRKLKNSATATAGKIVSRSIKELEEFSGAIKRD